jgi:putative hemolysin
MKAIDLKDMETLSPVFRGRYGHRLAELFMRIVAIDKVNNIYDSLSDYYGVEFVRELLKALGIKYVIGNAGRLDHLSKGAFITVSNHPYGGLDGIMLIDLIAGKRPEFKLMVNRKLAAVNTLKDNFISVAPTGNKKKAIDTASISGIRATLLHLKNGHPIGFFPSGAVSDLSLRDLSVRDRKWQNSIINLIQSVKVPVIPIHFFDKNSQFFYLLGLINWRIRLMRMPHEVFNKRGQVHRVGIGNLISVEEQQYHIARRTLGTFLRKAVYEMPLPASFEPPPPLLINRRIIPL